MNLKNQLCEAFCDTLTVSSIPAGLAIGTRYEGLGGDPIGVYVIGPSSQGLYHIQDDGISVPTLESLGADISNKMRREAFNELLSAYDVSYCEDTAELKTDAVSEAAVAPTVMRFLAFMLRLQDLALMAAERAASTFREDALRTIRALVGDQAELRDSFIVAPSLSEFPADLGIIAKGKPPVALFWGVSESKVYEALLLQAYAQSANIPCSVVTLIESQTTVSQKMRQRAANRLDASPYYRGDETQACARLLRSVINPVVVPGNATHQ
jgi:hypothetical protein